MRGSVGLKCRVEYRKQYARKKGIMKDDKTWPVFPYRHTYFDEFETKTPLALATSSNCDSTPVLQTTATATAWSSVEHAVVENHCNFVSAGKESM